MVLRRTKTGFCLVNLASQHGANKRSARQKKLAQIFWQTPTACRRTKRATSAAPKSARAFAVPCSAHGRQDLVAKAQTAANATVRNISRQRCRMIRRPQSPEQLYRAAKRANNEERVASAPSARMAAGYLPGVFTSCRNVSFRQ